MKRLKLVVTKNSILDVVTSVQPAHGPGIKKDILRREEEIGN